MRSLRSLLILCWLSCVLGFQANQGNRSLSISNPCNQPRIRKSWDASSAAERALYIEAIQLSMDRNLYIRFVEIHARNSGSAHNHCGFLVWHRRLLLAFENMLRGLGPRYACVTIPYWNYFSDYANFAAGRCRTIEGCSSILREMGGSRGNPRNINIMNSPVSGNCVAAPPCNHFCQDIRGVTCSRCVLRGNWANLAYRYPISIAQAAGATARSGAVYSQFSQFLETNFHFGIHDHLGSGMANLLVSPADPVFFSHHATVDLAQYLFFQCQRRSETPLTPQEATTLPYAFSSCFGGNPATMLIVNDQNQMINAHDHPSLNLAFENVGQNYYNFVDSHNLNSDNSYDYQIDPFLTGVLNPLIGRSCPNLRLQAKRLLQEESSHLSPAEQEYVDLYNKIANLVKSRKNSLRTKVSTNYTLSTPHQDLNDVGTQIIYTECLRHHRKFGVQDYSKEFKESSGVKQKPVCLDVIDKYYKGEIEVLLDE